MKRGILIVMVFVGIAGAVAYMTLRNLPPEAVADTASTEELRPVNIDVLANDRDRNGDSLRVIGVEVPANGTARIIDNGRAVTYTPRAGFFGTDTFGYTIVDPSNLTADAKVAVQVAFSSPDFHRRSQSASLSEMMQEPPSSVYGSTINVFFFRDEVGRMREITISGHADSLTCASASGAFADALLSSGSSVDDFLLAGAGRMAIPAPTPERLEALESDSKVREFKRLATKLSVARMMWQGKQMADASITTFLGSSVEEAEAKLAVLAADVTVKEYLSSGRPSESATAFERQALELQKTSGMLRVHNVDYSHIDAVRQRLQAAAKAGGTSIVRFDDLLKDRDAEAVVYAPMLFSGGADPVEIAVPVGEFSPEGFRQAAKLYRSALENAVVGSAERRLAYAKRALERNEQRQSDCNAMSQSDLDQSIGTEDCDRDGACKRGQSMTQREYCTISVPRNLNIVRGWRDDAQQLISRIKTMSERQDINRLDSLNYAAVIDAMLRNWALSFRQAQPAFDEWRLNGRHRAWRMITTAAQQAGVGRAALSGESVVFNVRLDGDTIRLRPMLIIDLRRTVVVVDPHLGVTAAVYPWELRSMETSTGPILASEQAPLDMLIDDPTRLARRLEAEPRREMSRLLEQLLAEMPSEPDSWRTHAAQARTDFVREIETSLTRELVKTSASVPDKAVPDAEKASDQLVKMQELMFVARHMPNVSPAFRMQTALVAAQWFAIYQGKPVPRNWQALNQSVPSLRQSRGASTRAKMVERLFFDELLADYVTNVVAKARVQDEAFVERLIGGQRGDLASTPNSTKPSVQTILTALVGGVERARSVLELRRRVELALAVFKENGNVSVSDLTRIIEAPLTEVSVIYHGRLWSEVQQVLRYYSIDAERGQLGPIEGQKFAAHLHTLLTQLDAELRRLKPLLSEARYGREQDAIVARILFDEGLYQDAYKRLAPVRSPLALFAPGLSWTVLAPTLKAVPERIELVRDNGFVTVRAIVAGEAHDVVRFDGLSQEDAEALVAVTPEPVLEWNQGDPLWEQVMLSTVPSRPRVIDIGKALLDDKVHVTALKAMVYACAAPGAHVLAAGGRCERAEGSTALHDRVQAGEGAHFVWPPTAEFVGLASQRFKREDAWKFAASSSR